MILQNKKTVSFLVSGRGSNFKAVADKILSGYIKADIGIVISNRPEAPALKKAEELGIKSISIKPDNFSNKNDHEKEVIKYLDSYNTDLVITAGYMRILSPDFVNHYRNRIINIHPSLLPSFPGKDAQQQALDYGVKITGCTTHFIDEGTDTGPIIMQAAVEIRENDDISVLSSRILEEEHNILTESVKLFCDDKLIVNNKTVYIKK